VSVLSLRGFSYRYPQTQAWALDELHLELDAGLHIVTGESGSGKSTLLRVCNGLVPHFHGGTVRGSATVAGFDILTTRTRDLAQHCGFLFQDPELQSVYATVERDVAFGLENLALRREEMHARVEEALAMVGTAHLRTRAVSTLSGGERQRLALAGVLAMRPAMLALDEPLAQLDAEGAGSLAAVLRGLAAHGTALLVSEHRLDRLLPDAASIMHIDGGRLTASGGSPADVSLFGARHDPRGLPSATRTAWSLSDVSLSIGGNEILSGVDASGAAGEVVVLMGSNGSGKTTLLRAIAGLLSPSSGRVERAPGRVAYLPQNPTSLLHQPTVRDEVSLTLRTSRDTDMPDRVLHALGLLHLAGRYPRDLSTGERQRVALAAVLAGSPAVALLDEPTRGMDVAARTALVALIGELSARGTSVVLATHDDELAARVAHRVLLLERCGVVETEQTLSAAEVALA